MKKTVLFPNGRETNLKSRQALPVTAKLMDDNKALEALKAEIICEPPNNNLSRFEGTVKIEGTLRPPGNGVCCILGNAVESVTPEFHE